MRRAIPAFFIGILLIGLGILSSLLFPKSGEDNYSFSPETNLKLGPTSVVVVDPGFVPVSKSPSRESVDELIVEEQEEVVSFKINDKYTDDIVAINKYLYQICDEEFEVYLDGERISPLFPMAVSLIETGHRANTSITFCALYPSAIIPITTLDDIDNMGVAKVIEQESWYKKLSNDFSTRDRGPLQMSPTYGAWGFTGHASEKYILSTLDIPEYVDDWWLEAAGETPGDRFNIRDIVGRLAVVCRSAASQVESRYYSNSVLMSCVLLDINHGFSSVYNGDFVNKKIGNWVSGTKAVEYASSITKPESIDIIQDYVTKHPGTLYISDNTAKSLYAAMFSEGLVGPVDEYICGTGKYSYVTYCHPIRMLYSLLALEAVYTGA